MPTTQPLIAATAHARQERRKKEKMDAGREYNRLQMFHSVAVFSCIKVGRGNGGVPARVSAGFWQRPCLYSFNSVLLVRINDLIIRLDVNRINLISS